VLCVACSLNRILIDEAIEELLRLIESRREGVFDLVGLLGA